MSNARMQIIIDGKSTGAVNATKELERQVESMSKKVQTAAQNLSSIGTKLSLGVTAPMMLVGKKALDMAMDVVESENLFTVSMGNMADSAKAWSEQFADSVGLNEYNVRKNLGTFNVMFDAMDMGTDKSYELAQGLTQLAYDMASFYNLDVEDAFLKLQAGIMGEIEPLRRLGIVVNETAVATYAYANGIAEQGEQLTEQEKILARYGVIMDATSKAQGDLGRTLESPANQLRIFREQVDLAAVELGKALLPMLKEVLSRITPLVEGFQNLSDEKKELIVNIGLFIAALGPALFLIGNTITVVNGLSSAMTSLSIATKLSNFELFAIAGAIINTVSAIYGIIKATNDWKAGVISLTEFLVKLAYPMIVVIEKLGILKQQVEAFKTALSGIPREVTTTIRTIHIDEYRNVHGGYTYQGGSKQSGGLVRNTGFVTDLNIPLVKGEAVLPAPIVKAIKQGQGSFAGLDMSGGSVVNNFNISQLVVREESDVQEIARELYDMQQQNLRGAGVR